MKEQNEQQKTSQDYIIRFYALVQELINYYSEYEELILEVQGFIKQNPEIQMDKEQELKIRNTNRFLRKLMTQIQIHYETFDIKDKDTKQEIKIKEIYSKINKQYLLDREELKAYIIEINKYTLEKLMPHIIQNSDMSKIYN